MRTPRAVVIGGGLAGMMVAKELRKRRVPVIVIEASARVGGKAGADLADGVREEHGFHVFPAWYLNTRRLLAEIGVSDNLVDLDHLHHLQKGHFPQFVTYYAPDSPQHLWNNIVHGLLPWHESLAVLYFSLDLASQSFGRRAFLDRISVNGFLRSRFYRTERIAEFQQNSLLQAGSIPSYELSAMSLQSVLKYWMQNPAPVFSLLRGNLHDTFSAPFEAHLRTLGADLRFGQRAQRLEVRGGRVVGIGLDDGSKLDDVGAEDIVVLATPPEVTLQLVNEDLYAAEDAVEDSDDAPPRLADVAHLQSVPMAALHLYLNRRIAGIPNAHVTLFQSRYQLSFIDVSQHWKDLPNTTLSLIASNFAPLAALPEDEMTRYLINELRAYIPEIRPEDIERSYLQPNVRVPLFLNTVGSWPFRPGTRTRLPNLYTAGDYCQSEADVTTMESAVMSGLCTARDVLKDEGLEADVGLIALTAPARSKLLVLKYAGLLAIGPIGLWNSLCRWFDDS